MPGCPACGEQNPWGARFWSACGALLTDKPAVEERKIVSVLFVDMVNFTSRSDQADPEDVRAILVPYHTRVKSEIESFGGVVEKFISDAIMAVFGAPVSHGDDAERAVRAGLRVLDAIQELSKEDPALDQRASPHRHHRSRGRECGIADTTGTLEPGKDADFVALRGNPTRRHQRHPRRGRRVRQRRTGANGQIGHLTGARPTSARRCRGRGPLLSASGDWGRLRETSAGDCCAIPRHSVREASAANATALRSYDRGVSPAARRFAPIMINRVQALVLGFLLMAWISLVVILVAAPEVYERRLRSLPGAQHVAEIVFVVALTAFIVLLSIGVLRRWRWMFWLILIAFLFGVLRIPVAVLQISGQMRPDGPPWYVILQGVIGLVQVLIALAMILGYRRSGVWGS